MKADSDGTAGIMVDLVHGVKEPAEPDWHVVEVTDQGGDQELRHLETHRDPSFWWVQ